MICSHNPFATTVRPATPPASTPCTRISAELLRSAHDPLYGTQSLSHQLVIASSRQLVNLLSRHRVNSSLRQLVLVIASTRTRHHVNSSTRISSARFKKKKKKTFIKFSPHSSPPRLSSRLFSSVVSIPVFQLFAISSTLSPCF